MSDQEARLNALIQRALAQQPQRRAPSSLEARVFEEITRRAALPWWRKSFSHWPQVPQAAFLAACAVFVMLGVRGAWWALSHVNELIAPLPTAAAWSELRDSLGVFSSLTTLVAVLARSVPAELLYGVGAMVFLFYLSAFGLGAAAYRMLYSHR